MSRKQGPDVKFGKFDSWHETFESSCFDFFAQVVILPHLPVTKQGLLSFQPSIVTSYININIRVRKDFKTISFSLTSSSFSFTSSSFSLTLSSSHYHYHIIGWREVQALVCWASTWRLSLLPFKPSSHISSGFFWCFFFASDIGIYVLFFLQYLDL